jgi:hypothetical protein
LKSRGRPKGNESQTKKNVEKLSCAACTELKKTSEYYVSYNPIHQSGRIPYCKSCLKKMICDSKGNVELDKVKSTLQLIDKPFLYNIWKSSLEDKMDVYGCYMKNLAMIQYRHLGWADSKMLPEVEHQLNYNTANSNSTKSQESKTSFILTDEIMEKWGFGYSPDEYSYFEKKWNKLIDNYGEKTSLHTEGLKTYIRFRVKEELSTAKGDVKEAKEWGSMASTAAKDAKINVSQLSKSDITGGVELLPQLFEAVESEVGIISILPKLKEQPIDDADLIIWCIVNYNRRLEDKPRVDYKDIWNFYDEMLNEYFQSQGYSKEQIISEKNKRNSIFRDLGKVYIEPVYEEGE